MQQFASALYCLPGSRRPGIFRRYRRVALEEGGERENRIRLPPERVFGVLKPVVKQEQALRQFAVHDDALRETRQQFGIRDFTDGVLCDFHWDHEIDEAPRLAHSTRIVNVARLDGADYTGWRPVL